MPYLPLEFKESQIFPKRTIAVRPDVHVMVSSGTLSNKLNRDTGTTAPVFELSYNLKNTLHGEVNRRAVELRSGYASLGFLGEVSCHSEYDRGADVELYSIWISPKVFDDFCEAVSGKHNINFHSFQKSTYSHHDFKSDAQENGILKKLGTCLKENAGPLNKLLLESYVLELLSINIERLLWQDSFDRQTPGLSKSEIEQLIYAREILLTHLDTPPTLLELSHLIHMNDCKLKRTFKQYYGKTVYAFIREQRLQKAFSLIQQQHYNVSQTAFAVGYTNVSHFSEAFRKQFGIAPSTLCKASRSPQYGIKKHI